MSRSKLHRAARKYAAAGTPVFPLRPRRKEPLTPHGHKDATTDLAQIDEWWQRWPDANVGLACNDLIVLDFDPRNGAPKTREDIVKRFGPWPQTLEAITGGGGRHIYFSRNGRTPPNKLGVGVDVKHRGGYVLAPPSAHPDGPTYQWADGFDDIGKLRCLPNPPDWVFPKSSSTTQRRAEHPSGGKLVEGTRNSTLTSLAGSMRWRGMSPEAIDAALQAENLQRCDPPLDEAEVAAVAKSVSRYEPAPESTQETALRDLNDEVCYIRSINAVADTRHFQLMRPSDFVSGVFADRRHSIATAKGSVHEVSTAQSWLQWPGRRTCEGVTFQPGAPLIVDGCLNLWKGWPAEPKEGDVAPFLELIDHLFQTAAQHKEWLSQWLAAPFQRPGIKLRCAVMIHGLEQGTGKTLLGETVAALYGEAGKLIGQEQLEREFNEYMDRAAFIVGDEVTTKGNRRDTAERLKNLITRPFVTVNTKYQPVYKLPNVAQFYLTSNHDDCLYLEDADRRFFVHRADVPPLSPEFTKRFSAWQKETDWKGALLHYLMHRVDCTAFDPYAPAPVTEAKRDMVSTGLSDLDHWIRQLPGAPIHPDSLVHTIRPLHTAEELRSMALGANSRYNLAGVGLAMRKAGFQRAHAAQQIKIGGRLMTLWATTRGLGPRQLETLIAAKREEIAEQAREREKFAKPGLVARVG